MSIFRILNDNAHRSPDELAALTAMSGFYFHPCGVITREVFDRLNLSGVGLAYFRWDCQNPGWDCDYSAEDAPKIEHSSFDNVFNNLLDWAFIEHEKRLSVDPFSINWKQYIEEYRKHVVSE